MGAERLQKRLRQPDIESVFGGSNSHNEAAEKQNQDRGCDWIEKHLVAVFQPTGIEVQRSSGPTQ